MSRLVGLSDARYTGAFRGYKGSEMVIAVICVICLCNVCAQRQGIGRWLCAEVVGVAGRQVANGW